MSLAAQPVDTLLPVMAAGDIVLAWYDLTCPFCYLAEPRNAGLREAGAVVVELPFQAHPELPPGGVEMGARRGPMYETIARQAQAEGLPLRWRPHLPNSRLALAAAEWVRRRLPDAFAPFRHALFQAHFAGGLDIGDGGVVARLARDHGVDDAELGGALADGRAFDGLARSQAEARRLGVSGTPAWASAGRLLVGLQSPEALAALAADAVRAGARETRDIAP